VHILLFKLVGYLGINNTELFLGKTTYQWRYQ